MASISTQSLDFTVTHRGNSYPVSLCPDATVDQLQSTLEELTSVPRANQKLLYKGKKSALREGDALAAAGFKTGLKVQMLGSTAEELGEMKQVEGEHQRRERIMKERALKPQAKVRSTASPSSSAALQFRFHEIVPLPHLPSPESARALLARLASDPAIVHVMQQHRFAVGTLTELAPHEQPHLLGLNVNAGQAIKLRLRTDAYDGFRTYKEVRRVLCHELTHNVWGDHDNNFKELNSQLNREVAGFERSAAEGAHQLRSSTGAYEPLEADAHMGHVLGGSSTGAAQDSREERRRRMLEATMSRLRREEEELEQSCGTAGPAADQQS
ncbi:hypothetical protein PHLGIDRAFT_74106 [Phlebiopsis gigantea 11061_1 CR5-6]|uniref:WLM domain-containing protein n=1 Tax=Phlebiopsis gigantea (strain 11061_1 CR5-6) TaxID=745531 RepID=A0A0C3PHY8_PHLG1|nr:hypothetical protein PHLGIDRAFT_74106 [Phlebiopsis gigantea 11061_1 CR5-6]